MSKKMITVENLGKMYHITNQGGGYQTIRDRILSLPSRLKGTHSKQEEFWALKDVSFEIEAGGRVGIIGRNGAGKSTLLKLLSRIIKPTNGRAIINGRVASLLEVGTGFHPELTGRENIFMNGALLGMTRSEIKSKFDEIVDFAEVEKFIDTPVKRYSSGMYVRLAFAVAAHLEPEILLVDEVLAVGDAQFQKKCLGKMEDVSKKDGRTILFVSHNMEAIEKLCNFGIVLHKGKVSDSGNNLPHVIRNYLAPISQIQTLSSKWVNELPLKFDNEYFTLYQAYLVNENGNVISMPIQRNSGIYLQLEGVVKQFHPGLIFGYYIYDINNVNLYCSLTTDEENEKWPEIKKGKLILKTKIPVNLLQEGIYRIELQIVIHLVKFLIQPGNDSPILNLHIYGSQNSSSISINNRPGLFSPIYEWKNEQLWQQ